MSNMIIEIRNSYENKITALQREIERLRTKMTMVISALQEDIGEQEGIPLKATITEHPVTAEKAQTHVNSEPIMRIRVIQAVERMPLSGFSTAELLRSINNDGNTKMVNKNRALKLFKSLITEGLVTVLQEHSGKKGGIYKKAVN